MRLACVVSVVALLIASTAHAAEAPAVLVSLRNHIEASDYRATGQLVRVDASGNRIRYALSVKGLWFGGAMHTLLDVVPKGVAARAHEDEHVRILLEMRSDGRDIIKVFRPHQAELTMLPFDKWDESMWGGTFSYEDLLEPQYFWPGQAILRSAMFGGHHCEVLKSTPGPSDRTHYSDIETWLDRDIDYPVYAEKVMKQGGIVKEFTYFGLRQSSGVWTATQIEAKIRGHAGSTFLIIKRGSAKAHLSATDFSPEQISHFEDHQ